MISRILYFLIIIFCINAMVVGLGLMDYDDTNLNNLTIVGDEPGDYQSLTNPSTSFVETGDPEDVVESATRPEFLPEVGEGYTMFQSISGIANGLLFGWATILYILGLPAIMLYLILGVVGVLQTFSMFYLIMYLIAAIRGRI